MLQERDGDVIDSNRDERSEISGLDSTDIDNSTAFGRTNVCTGEIKVAGHSETLFTVST